jgi:DNA-binding ferritin-like protein (Dps family)
MFLDLIKVDGVTGRQAMIAAAGAEIGHVDMFEGESLDRKWTETQSLNTPKAGREYTVALPEGYQAKVRTIPLQMLGRAAALSDGRIADGILDLDEFASTAHKKVVLGRHFAYRLYA